MEVQDPEFLSRLLTGIRCVIATRYTLNASAVLWMVDWLQTLPVEISMIWGSRFNLVKLLFFINRYPVVDLIAAYILVYNGIVESCRISMIFGIVSYMVGIVTAEAIMFLRLYALSGAKRWLKWYLITHFTVIHVAAFVTISIALSQLVWIQSDIPSYVPCIAIEDGATLAMSVFSMLLASELIILSMTLYIGLRRNEGQSSPLYGVLYRDGVVYFVALVASSAMNVTLAAVLPAECAGILCTIPQRVLHSILAGRAVIQLRVQDPRRTDNSLTLDSHKTSAQWPSLSRMQDSRLSVVRLGGTEDDYEPGAGHDGVMR